MGSRGRQTLMPRAALPRDQRRAESVIWGLALGLALLFALGQVITVLAAAPAVVALHAEKGGAMPMIVAWAQVLGPLGITSVLGLIDALLLFIFVQLARRYWVGLAFLPPVMYLGIGSVVLWLLVSGVLFEAALT